MIEHIVHFIHNEERCRLVLLCLNECWWRLNKTPMWATASTYKLRVLENEFQTQNKRVEHCFLVANFLWWALFPGCKQRLDSFEKDSCFVLTLTRGLAMENLNGICEQSVAIF